MEQSINDTVIGSMVKLIPEPMMQCGRMHLRYSISFLYFNLEVKAFMRGKKCNHLF